MCTARGLQPFNASCVCWEGRRSATIFSPNLNPTESITTKLHQEVGSSWAYSPYSPCIMSMPIETNARASLSIYTTLQRVLNHPKRLMHRVSCMPFLPCLVQEKESECRATAQRKRSLTVLNNPILALRRGKHEQALSFSTCEEKRRVGGCTGKAQQHVDAWITHMHWEHSVYTSPTCALRAPFISHTFHLCFDLYRAREVNAQTANERNGDNPSVLTKLTTRTRCIRVR